MGSHEDRHDELEGEFDLGRLEQLGDRTWEWRVDQAREHRAGKREAPLFEAGFDVGGGDMEFEFRGVLGLQSGLSGRRPGVEQAWEWDSDSRTGRRRRSWGRSWGWR